MTDSAIKLMAFAGTILALLLSSVFVSSALAHAGHDHSAPESHLIHMTWALVPVLLVVVGLALWRFYQRTQK